ncbi:hypothetical protein D3C76_1349130 [compost metagenome]
MALRKFSHCGTWGRAKKLPERISSLVLSEYRTSHTSGYSWVTSRMPNSRYTSSRTGDRRFLAWEATGLAVAVAAEFTGVASFDQEYFRSMRLNSMLSTTVAPRQSTTRKAAMELP